MAKPIKTKQMLRVRVVNLRILPDNPLAVATESSSQVASIHSRLYLSELAQHYGNEAYRGQGMCRKLMSSIESALCFLNVENLIIPSVREKMIGFRKLDLSMEKEIMVHNALMFQDSERLQTVLPSSSHFPTFHSPSHLDKVWAHKSLGFIRHVQIDVIEMTSRIF